MEETVKYRYKNLVHENHIHCLQSHKMEQYKLLKHIIKRRII